MSEELKITKERVLSAAGKCGTAKDILKELFPEVFEVSPPEWEDVTGTMHVWGLPNNLYLRDKETCELPFVIAFKNEEHTGHRGSCYKFEDGRIWRKRED